MELLDVDIIELHFLYIILEAVSVFSFIFHHSFRVDIV